MDEGALTDDEIRALRKLVREQERMTWLMARIKIWVRYIIAGLAVPPVVIAAYDAIHKLVSR